MIQLHKTVFFIFIGALAVVSVTTPACSQSEPWQSEIVYYGAGGKLIYVADSTGNRIPDFSYAGYKNSEEKIPFIPVVMTLSPVEGDNTAHIQNALDQMAGLPLDANGFRGALLLAAGEYEIRGTLRLRASGVVLRGAGDGDDPQTSTILRATGDSPHQRTVLIAGGGSPTRWQDMVSGSRTDIVSEFVPVGSRRFRVADVTPFAVGDNIIIYHPCTDAWLQAIDYGGTHSDDPGAEPGKDVPWRVGSQPLVFNRYIKAINGDTITIDAPVFNHLDRNLAQAYIYKYNRRGLVTQIGIENLRIDIETSGRFDENHAWNAIDLYQVEDAWVRNCTLLHFGLSGIRTNTATRITVEHCAALDPVAIITGGRMYNFNAYTASQLILFKNCRARNGRHSYMSNGTSWTSGIVFLDCTSEGAYAASEGHRRWSMGLLYDNHKELDGPRLGYNPRLLGLYNRGYFGTSHGWAAAHSVAWNCDVAGGELHVQKPPTAQNYAIGCRGIVTGASPPNSFAEPEGYIEGSNRDGLEPRSLFEAQFLERTGLPVGVRDNENPAQQPVANFSLEQNYPNPFNPQTVIRYQLPARSDVQMILYSTTGRAVRHLVMGRIPAGYHSVVWDAMDDSGRKVASGVYLYVLRAQNLTGQSFAAQKKLILLK